MNVTTNTVCDTPPKVRTYCMNGQLPRIEKECIYNHEWHFNTNNLCYDFLGTAKTAQAVATKESSYQSVI